MTRFRSDDSIGLLLEPREDLEAGSLTGTDDPAVLATVAGIGRLNDLQADDDLETFAQRMGELLQELNGFDRVMVYRFDSDWNGTVIAEARQPQVEASYLGLTFPASDIPPQARQLFQQAAARPTIDVACDPQPLLYADGVSGPADLSHCSYRAVAPVHREYLGNMAVRASLTLALTVRGKLWGLVACHHLSGPRKVDPLQLALLRTLSEILSLALARVLERQEHGLLERVHQLGHWLQQRSSLSPRPDFQADVVRQLIRRLKPMLGCDSFVYRDGDQLYRSSGAPSAAAIETIAQFFGRWSREHAQPALVTAELQGYGLPLSAADARKAAGAVVLGDGRSTQQLMLFRLPAVVPSTWAGDPDGRVLQPEGSDRLDPRSSFELFLRENRTDAEAWPAGIVPSVDKLRAVLRQAHWITFSRIEAQERESLRLQAVAAEERMSHAALHDPLTGLPNRRFLQDRLQQLIARPREQAPAWALLHLDLDDFKAVNDNFGHDTGDQLLVKVAQILRQQVREQDLVIRLGGDEFVVLAQRLDGDDEEELPVLARRLIASVSRAHLIKEHICRIGLSIGIACCDADQLPVSALLNRSDLALYESKRRGKTCFSFYSEELDARLREEMLLLSELQDALEWDTSEQPQLDVYLQPQFSVADGALIGAEALLRWHHPRLGLLTPPAFLYVADKNRLMASLDAYVLKRLDVLYQQWREAGIVLQKLSVNVSGERLMSPTFLEQLQAVQIPPSVLTLELLESIYLDQPSPALLAVLNTLRERGFRVELDDFGTGHTSVLGLMGVRPDGLKVDQGLVVPALVSAETSRLLSLVVGMGHALEIDVIAEGVESPAHVDLIKRLGCQRMQGFGLSRPLEPAAFKDLCLQSC